MQMPTLIAMQQARTRIAGMAIRTPLVRLEHPGPQQIYLKFEQLQPIGSFKIRAAANALLSMDPQVRASGVTTASAGNFAQGLGYVARALGVAAKSIVPETAAHSKLDALERLGVALDRRPFEEWWSVLQDPVAHGFGAEFVHPFANEAVIAGNATIGLEILEEIDPGMVLVPFGGGGLATGVAAAIKARGCKARILAVESEAGQPVAAAFAKGEPVSVPFDSRTFITGMGSPQVLASMWPHVRTLLDGAVSVSVRAVADAVRLLVDRHHIVAEGAGAAPVAAALANVTSARPIVCIVSGGHLDADDLSAILKGDVPRHDGAARVERTDNGR